MRISRRDSVGFGASRSVEVSQALPLVGHGKIFIHYCNQKNGPGDGGGVIVPCALMITKAVLATCFPVGAHLNLSIPEELI